MTPPLPDAPALVGVVAGWWAPAGSARADEPAHRMARSTYTGRRGKTALCGQVLTQLHPVPDGAAHRTACADCATSASRIPTYDAATSPMPVPPPSAPRDVRPAPARQGNTAAARVTRRRAFRDSWLRSERACAYDAAPYDPPDPQLLAGTAIPHA